MVLMPIADLWLATYVSYGSSRGTTSQMVAIAEKHAIRVAMKAFHLPHR